MRTINKKIGRTTENLQILLTFKEAESLVAKLNDLFSSESKYDHFELADEERRHKLILVIPERNNIEEQQALGEWFTSGPIYPKNIPQS